MACEYQIRVEVEDQEREIQVQPEAYNQASGGTIEITENGQYDVTKYQTADVAVPLPQGQIDIKQNGIVNVYDYATANVAVPADTSDIFNTTIVSDEASASYLMAKSFLKYDSPSMPNPVKLTLSLRTAQSLLHGWGFKHLAINGEVRGSMYQMFYNSGVESITCDGLNTSTVTSMGYMFSYCGELTEIGIKSLDTSAVTTMRNMFAYCSNLVQIDLGGLDTSSVKSMQYIFDQNSSLEYVNLSGWSTESITNNDRMFQGDRALKAVIIDSPKLFRLTTSGAFAGSSIENGGIGFVYVPDNLVDEYKTATNWVMVADQIKPLSELPQEVKDAFHMQ